MDDTMGVIGAPVPLSLGGTEYQLSPLTVGALATFRAEAHERVWGEADRRIARLNKIAAATQDAKLEVERWAREMIDSGRAEAEFATDCEGTAALVWLCLLERHPDITRTEIKSKLRFIDLEAVQAKLDRISFPRKTDAPDTGTPSPNAQTPPPAPGSGGTPPESSPPAAPLGSPLMPTGGPSGDSSAVAVASSLGT